MVDILMAVYNGERFLKEQLNSVFSQTYTDWKLLICDDASTDGTMRILEEYRGKYPDKVEIYRNTENSGSPQKNFFELMRKSKAPYLMTCDHDDVWLPYKISVTLKKMQKLEKRFGDKKPLLVHTDLQVVDENLNLISSSMFKTQKLNPNATELRDFIPQNHVTGCTMMINRALAETVKVLPKDALMHDWWFALVAASFGAVGFVNRPTILYRQHGGNQVGAKSVSQMNFIVKRVANSRKTKETMNDTYRQAAAFLKEFEDKLTENQRELMQEYIALPQKSKAERIRLLCKGRYFKYGLVRKIGQFLYI